MCLSPDHRGLVRSLDVKFSEAGAVTMPPVVFEGVGNTPGGCLFLPGWRSFQSSSLLELSFSFPCRSPKRSMPILLLGWTSCCHLKHTISPKQATVPNSKAARHKKARSWGLAFPFSCSSCLEDIWSRLWTTLTSTKIPDLTNKGNQCCWYFLRKMSSIHCPVFGCLPHVASCNTSIIVYNF